MSLELNITLMRALKYFYDGEVFGVQEGDFIYCFKKQGIILPSELKDFLRKYGRFDVNRWENRVFLPYELKRKTIKIDGIDEQVILFGILGYDQVGIRESEINKTKTKILREIPNENNDELAPFRMKETGMTVDDYLRKIFLESYPAQCNSTRHAGTDVFREFIEYYQEDISRARLEKFVSSVKSKKLGKICWDAEHEVLLALTQRNEREEIAVIRPAFAIQELEALVTQEFYEKPKNCNYEHILKLLNRIINYYKKNQEWSELIIKYQMAGTCCWKMKRWKEAEGWYNMATELDAKILKQTLINSQNLYETIGNFLHDREDVIKCQLAYKRADKIGEFAGENIAQRRGNRDFTQARILAEAGRLQEAIDLCNHALELYGRSPRDCKYDIARCQQLRGELRQKIKLKQKQYDNKQSGLNFKQKG